MKSHLPFLALLGALLGVIALVGIRSGWWRESTRVVREAPSAEPAPSTPERDLRAPADSPVATQAAPSPAPPPLTVTDDALAASMHQVEQANPARALELARQGQRAWPNGPRAAEFAATEVKCLYLLGMPSEGRGAAEAMVNKYPNSHWAREVERQTGAHPYVNH